MGKCLYFYCKRSVISFSQKGNNNMGPNLAAANEKESPPSPGISKAVGQKFITGPDGAKWASISHAVDANQES